MHCQVHDYPESWCAVCEVLAAELGQAVFKNWFKNMAPLDLKSAQTRLGVEGLFFKDYVISHYGDSLRAALRSVFPNSKGFVLEVLSQDIPSSRAPPESQTLPASCVNRPAQSDLIWPPWWGSASRKTQGVCQRGPTLSRQKASFHPWSRFEGLWPGQTFP